MSSDPTQPVPEWWQQPQVPKKDQSRNPSGSRVTRTRRRRRNLRGPGIPDTQDSQATRQYPTNQGVPGGPTFTPNQGGQSDQGYEAQQGHQPPASGFPSGQEFPSGQGYPSDQGFPSGQGYQPASGFPSGQAYQQDQDYRGNQGYQGPPGAQTYPANQGFPAAQGYQAGARTRRRRRRWPWITLIVIIVVLVGGDRAANAYAEDQMASQIQSSLALSGKPHVTIQGFPFLTQLAARDFQHRRRQREQRDRGTGRAARDRQPDRHAARDAHPRDQQRHDRPVHAPRRWSRSRRWPTPAASPQGITLAADGPNQIKATIDILGFSSEATAKVTQVGNDKINVKIIDVGGVPADVLGNLADFNISIPKLPAGVKIQNISVTQQGLRITVSGQNTTLSQ